MADKYIYKCVDCNNIVEFGSNQDTVVCPVCDKDDVRLRRIIYGFSGVLKKTGDYEHISDALAMNPNQIAEHKQLFPDIDVLPDGRPRFTSVRQQERYCDATGFYKRTQKVRNRL